MPFIGTQPEVGGYSVLDALTASATASYTLQKGSANFVPNTANQLLVSLNGVIQKPGSSFTVSGSTLTFSSALTSSDSIDFIVSMGEPLLIGTPSDGTVNTTQLATNAVSTAKIASSAVTNAKVASGVSASKLTTGTLPHLQLPSGSVLQVLNMRTDNNKNTTSTSLVNTDMTLTITPKATSSKILVWANMYEVYTGSTNTSAMFAINRGGSIIGDHQGATLYYSPASQYGNVQIQYYDEPNTTSATEYKIQYKSNNGNAVAINGDNTQNHLMLMEIAG